MAILIFVFAEDILRFLYGDGLSNNVIDELYYATKMLKISSVSIIYYAFLQTFTAILQSIGKSHIPFIVMLCSLGVRIITTILFVSIPQINIFGAILGHSIFLSITIIILAMFVRKYIDMNFKMKNQLLAPVLISLVVMILMIAIRQGLNLFLNYFVSLIISALIGSIIYILWVYFGRVFEDREKRKFLFKRKKWSKK
jgi:stage V sporulation protein B